MGGEEETYGGDGEVVEHHAVVGVANARLVAVGIVTDVKEKELQGFEDHGTLLFACCEGRS